MIKTSTLKIFLKDYLTDREIGFLYDSMKYMSSRPTNISGPSGFPGHNLIIIIVKLLRLLIVISSLMPEDRARMISNNLSKEPTTHDVEYIDRMFKTLCTEDSND